MPVTMHKIKIYSRLIGIGLLMVVVLIFMASNRVQVTVKFLGWEIWQTPLFLFMFAMAGLGVLVYLVGRKIRRVVMDFRLLRREEKERKSLVKDVQKEIENKSKSE